jgi:LacI family transcriptional regulator
MTLIPHRTVASQVAQVLRVEIAKGTWRGWLPGERVLCETVQASRNTLRAALAQLRAEGVVAPSVGLGTRIVANPPAPLNRDAVKTIGVLIPEPIGRLRPLIALWIDELKDLLLAEGCRLRVYAGRQFYQVNPARNLERLVAQHGHEAWLLVRSTEAMQRWFAARNLPCLVAGSTFADVALPHYDLDHRSICRHAAGVLLRMGHRRIALLNCEARLAGDVDSETGFREGVQRSSWPEAIAEMLYHRDDVASVARALGRLLDRKHPTTGLVVSNSYAYLATTSVLAQRGLRIPRDISLISRDDDPFLGALAPAPARYVVSPHAFAKKVIGSLLQLVARETFTLTPSQAMLQPKFSLGGSVARVR